MRGVPRPGNVARVVSTPEHDQSREHLRSKGGTHAQALFTDKACSGAQPRQAFLELILSMEAMAFFMRSSPAT